MLLNQLSDSQCNKCTAYFLHTCMLQGICVALLQEGSRPLCKLGSGCLLVGGGGGELYMLLPASLPVVSCQQAWLGLMCQVATIAQRGIQIPLGEECRARARLLKSQQAESAITLA